MSVTEVGTRNQFRISNAIERSWEVMSANFVFFGVIMALVALLSMAIFELSYHPKEFPTAEEFESGAITVEYVLRYFAGFLGAYGLAILVSLLPGPIGYGLCGLATLQHLHGEQRPLGDNLAQTLKQTLPLFGVSVLWILAVLAGSIFFVIPGMMLAVRWGLCCQVCLIEKTGPIASLKRSAELTDGNRWMLFATGILVLMANSLVMQLTGIFGLVGSVLIQGVVAGYFYCLSVTVYEELRSAKEGIGSQAMPEVFA